VRDTRYEWAYIFGAVCPERGVGAGLVLPFADTEAMTLHLAEIAGMVAPGAHAVLVLDGAGWHRGDDLVVPPNLTLLKLPPYAPELNSAENIWEYLRKNKLVGMSRPMLKKARGGAAGNMVMPRRPMRQLGRRHWLVRDAFPRRPSGWATACRP
jgi:hypothetical protein